MKTKIEKWRNYFFCQCQWIRFTAAALWCLFFVGAGPKVQGQQTQWPSNSLSEAASDAANEASMVSDTSTNLTSTNQIEQAQPPVSSSQSESGVMAYPTPSWSGQTISNSPSGAMAYPAPASSGSSSQSGAMAYPAPSWPGQTNSTSAAGVMAYPSPGSGGPASNPSGAMAYPAPSWPGQTNSTSAAGALAYPAPPSGESASNPSGVMAFPAPVLQGQTNSTPAAESTPAPAAPPTQPPPAPVVEQPASAPAPVAEQPAPAPAPAPEQAAPTPAPETTPPSSPAPTVSTEQAAPPPTATPPTEQTSAPSEGFSMSPPMLKAPRATKNEVSASGDIMFGSGKVSLPLGYSLVKSTGGGAGFTPQTFDVPRSSVYYGGTLSYSYGQAWYVDLSIAKGNSSGSQAVPTGEFGSLPSSFSIDDTWYQLYIKYTFPQLRGKRFSAYLRAGASYITATLNDEGTGPATGGRYSQNDQTQDILGNLGAGLAYNLFSTHRLRVDLQGEIEGFGGERTQKSLENLSADPRLTFVSDNINNTLYGGIGIATVHLEYRMGHAGLFKIFGDAGIEARYALVQYPQGGGTPSEYLWGPYIKAGLRYSF